MSSRDRSEPQIATSVLRYVVKSLVAQGVDAGELASRSGLDPWHAYGQTVSRRLLHEVWEVGARLAARSDLGLHMAANTSAQQWKLLGQLPGSATNIGDALLQLSRAARVSTDASRLSLRVEGDRCDYQLDPVADGLYHPMHIELLVASSFLLVSRACGERMELFSVNFRHSPPEVLDVHKAFFTREPSFKAAANGFAFDSALLSHPLRHSDPDNYRRLSEQVHAQLSDRRQDSDVLRRVREAIHAELPDGSLNSETIAARLQLHPKTLSRHLRHLGTTYRAVLEAQRYELAVVLLADSRLSLEQVALRLGYSESSAFQRAFKRWSDLSPAQFRSAQD